MIRALEVLFGRSSACPHPDAPVIITEIDDFLAYYDRAKGRTRRLLDLIPEDHLEWSPPNGGFTLGDLVRHLALLERGMFAENVRGNPTVYSGCGPEFASTREEVIALFDRCTAEAREIFAGLTAEDLQAKCLTPAGTPITTWKWLRALLEHEAHHRGQIYLHLAALGVETPPLFGLTSEEIVEVSGSGG